MKLPDLGKQIGPLPLGAWLVVVAGGLGIALYTRNSGGGTEPEVVEDTSGVPGVGTGPGWTAVPPPTDAPPGEDDDIETNEEWHRRAVDLLSFRGALPVDADRAITNYLSAQPLTAVQRLLVNTAIGFLGVPPIPPGNPVEPDPNPGTPTPTPTAPPKVPWFWGTAYSKSIVFRWTGLPNWWKYRIYRIVGGKANKVADVTASSGNVVTVSYELKGLKPKTPYTNFVVVAVNSAGKQGPFSNMISFTTK